MGYPGFNLNWAHIDGLDLSGKTINQDARIRIHAYGKGKRPAPLFQKNTVPGNFLSIQKIYRFRFKDNPTRETPVFCNIHGERITTFNKSLNALLDACDLRPATCDLRTDAFGRKFSSL